MKTASVPMTRRLREFVNMHREGDGTSDDTWSRCTLVGSGKDVKTLAIFLKPRCMAY